jgi:xanthine dehydrogenase YagS FAD-binding subunit
MRPFHYTRADDAPTAVRLATGSGSADPMANQFIAGGTTMLDLMKLGSINPAALVDINALETRHGEIVADTAGLRLGALVRMAQAARDDRVVRDYPVIAQSLALAASPQLRNMASLGGNVLQRTRCQYFRDPAWQSCNKRVPGTGCAALDGVNRKHAVLGVSDRCIAAYPGDFAVALTALGATVETLGPQGRRSFAIEQLHRDADHPEIETTLAPGELITGFVVPAGAWTRRSLYLKIRDRQSYAFALASAAVAVDLDGDRVRTARIALGGLAYRPWRAREAEAVLTGRPLNRTSAMAAAQAAFATARPRPGNAAKVEVGRRMLVRALLQAGTMDV